MLAYELGSKTGWSWGARVVSEWGAPSRDYGGILIGVTMGEGG